MASQYLSNIADYQSEIITAFTAFLKSEQSADKTISAYVADINEFMAGMLKNTSGSSYSGFTEPGSFARLINADSVNSYLAVLRSADTPVTSCNRKLAAFKAFARMAESKSWAKAAPILAIPPVFDISDLTSDAFEEFLEREGASLKTRTNYRSDVKNFLAYIISTNPDGNVRIASPQDLLTRFTPQSIENYKTSELTNRTPISTINRRLSAIRAFARFAIDKHWIILNPADSVPNLKDADSADSSPYHLNQYREFLRSQGKNDLVVTEAVSDINNFVTWLDASTATS